MISAISASAHLTTALTDIASRFLDVLALGLGLAFIALIFAIVASGRP